VIAHQPPTGSWLPATGLRLSDWFEHWFPDAFALALVAVAVVFLGCLAIGRSPVQTAQWFGAGFWDLVAFTMQMAMIIITGYTVAVSAPLYRVIRRMAEIPKDGRTAAAFVGLFSMLSSLISWSFSLIFSALLAREVTHRVHGADYRAVGAAAYLGIGSIWALGLSSSAALIMAAPASLPQSIQQISGVIPLSQTLGLWQSLLMAAVLATVSFAICYYSAPAVTEARSMSDMGVAYAVRHTDIARPEKPGEWLEYSPLLTILMAACGVAYLVREVLDRGPAIILDLNHYVFAFLIAGLLLHWRPRSFMRAVSAGVPSVAGVPPRRSPT
jgi:short-chain fatty acids transporter